MGIFNKKEEVNLEDFCREFYNKTYLSPVVDGINVGDIFYKSIRNEIIEKDPTFAKIDLENFSKEILVLQFELFALAWMHKFVGKFALSQGIFTKQYLRENKMNEVWTNMGQYNQYIGDATLDWLSGLGTVNSNFWHRMRMDVSAKNIEEDEKMGGNEGEVVDRINSILFSENAWKQGFILRWVLLAFYRRIGIENLKEFNNDAVQHIFFMIRMIYDGASQPLDNIKIKK
jgi:hypothetical protein